MAAELERKRAKPGEEEGGKRAKRPRLEEDSAGSEQELALLPSDEDLFTPPVGGREDGEKKWAVIEGRERVRYVVCIHQ